MELLRLPIGQNPLTTHHPRWPQAEIIHDPLETQQGIQGESRNLSNQQGRDQHQHQPDPEQDDQVFLPAGRTDAHIFQKAQHPLTIPQGHRAGEVGLPSIGKRAGFLHTGCIQAGRNEQLGIVEKLLHRP